METNSTMIEIPEDVLFDALLTYGINRLGAHALVDDIKDAARAAENQRLEREPRDSRRY